MIRFHLKHNVSYIFSDQFLLLSFIAPSELLICYTFLYQIDESFSYHTSAKSDPKAHAKVAPVSALLEVVHSETPQVISKQEDSYENLLVSSGAPGRVVQAFTMLNESPEAQVHLSYPALLI